MPRKRAVDREVEEPTPARSPSPTPCTDDLLSSTPSRADPVDSVWLRRVQDAYAHVCREYNRQLSRHKLSIFKRNAALANKRHTPIRAVQQTSRLAVMSPDMCNGNTDDGDSESAVVRFLKGGVGNRHFVRTLMPYVPPVPFGANYMPVGSCIATPDEHRLTHVPYIACGGERSGADGFEQTLLTFFEDGVHGLGTGVGNGVFVSDRIMYDVLRRCLHQSHTGDSPSIVDDAFYLPPALVRACVHAFPEKCLMRTLRFKWIDWVRAYGNVDDVARLTARATIVKNIDDVHGYGSVPADVAVTLNSHRTLMCRRCAIYDCLLHGLDDHDQRSFVYHDRPTHKRPPPTEVGRSPCGPHCHTLAIVADKQSSPTRRSSRGNKTPSPHKTPTKCAIVIDTSDSTEMNGWTARDMSMLRVLRLALDNDACRIARAMYGRRTCAQVHTMLERDGHGQSTAAVGGSPAVSPRSVQRGLQRAQNEQSKRVMSHKDQFQRFRAAKWSQSDASGGKAGKMDNRTPYHPCHHDGACTASVCVCVQNNTTCLKWCRCSSNCVFRFPGCRCAPGGCARASCPCFKAARECDPDVCTMCGADDDVITVPPRCRNVNIQRGLKEHVRIAPSDLAGWGLFTSRPVPRHTFIGEYTGELISSSEADRRGAIYDRLGCSYLFALNDDWTIDATHIGNKMRFANHSKSAANCYAKVLMVNGDHRIGVWAQRDIDVGEELFFDYAYNMQQTAAYVEKEPVSIARRAAAVNDAPPTLSTVAVDSHSQRSSTKKARH